MAADLALYIHWPFCVSKCPYCDFNSHVREAIDQQAWPDALIGRLEESGLARQFMVTGTLTRRFRRQVAADEKATAARAVEGCVQFVLDPGV